MNTRETYATKEVKGQIRRRLVDVKGNVIEDKLFNNIVTYGATNLLAKAISGDNTVKISHIRAGGVATANYAAAESAGTTYSTKTPVRSDKVMYYAGNPNPGHDLVVTVPAVFLRFEGNETEVLVPAQQTTNVVFYQATLDYSTGNGFTFDELGMYGNADATMFSHAKVDPIGKTSAFQIEYEWSLIFR